MSVKIVSDQSGSLVVSEATSASTQVIRKERKESCSSSGEVSCSTQSASMGSFDLRQEKVGLREAVKEFQEALGAAGIPPRIFLKATMRNVIQFSLALILGRCMSGRAGVPFEPGSRAKRCLQLIVQFIGVDTFIMKRGMFLKILEGITAPKKLASKYVNLLEKLDKIFGYDRSCEFFFYNEESRSFQEKEAFNGLQLLVHELYTTFSSLQSGDVLEEFVESKSVLEKWFFDNTERNINEKEASATHMVVGAFDRALRCCDDHFKESIRSYHKFDGLKPKEFAPSFLSNLRGIRQVRENFSTHLFLLKRGLRDEDNVLKLMKSSQSLAYREVLFAREEGKLAHAYMNSCEPLKEIIVNLILSITESHGDLIDLKKKEVVVQFFEQLLDYLMQSTRSVEKVEISEELRSNPFFKEVESDLMRVHIILDEMSVVMEKNSILATLSPAKRERMDMKRTRMNFRTTNLACNLRGWFDLYQKGLDGLKQSEIGSFAQFLDCLQRSPLSEKSLTKEVSTSSESSPEFIPTAWDVFLDKLLTPSIEPLARFIHSSSMYLMPLEIIDCVLQPWFKFSMKENIRSIDDAEIELIDLKTQGKGEKKKPSRGGKASKQSDKKQSAKKEVVAVVPSIVQIPLSSVKRAYFEALSPTNRHDRYSVQAAHSFDFASCMLPEMEDRIARRALIRSFVMALDNFSEQEITSLTLRYNPDAIEAVLEKHDLAHRLSEGGIANSSCLEEVQRLGPKGSIDVRYPSSRKGPLNIVKKLLDPSEEGSSFADIVAFFEGHFNLDLSLKQLNGELPKVVIGEESIAMTVIRDRTEALQSDRIVLEEEAKEQLLAVRDNLEELKNCVENVDQVVFLDELIAQIDWMIQGKGIPRRLYPVMLIAIARASEYAILSILKDRIVAEDLMSEEECYKDHRLAPLFSMLYFGYPGFQEIFEKLQKTKHKALEYFVSIKAGEEFLEAIAQARVPEGFSQKGVAAKSNSEMAQDLIQRMQESVQLIKTVLSYRGTVSVEA